MVSTHRISFYNPCDETKLMNLLFPTAWIASILCVMIISFIKKPLRIPTISFGWRTFVVLGIILLPAIVRILLYQPNRIHGDDLLTASFSMAYHPRTTPFFAGVPTSTEWVASFPAPYFLFQKLFLRLFGASVLTVKLSVIPYVLIVSAMTYSIAAYMFNPFTGAVAVVLYAFMAISLYLETLGLHFISSTAIFMIFFYATLRSAKSTAPFWPTITGVACAACYLSYTSSYIALSVLLVGILTQKKLWKKSAWILIGFLITIAPFATYAIKTDNYFIGRINQISLLSGSWSNDRETAKTLGGALSVIQKNLVLSLRSFVEDGIGGHGGYLFDRKAFFNHSGLFLFLLGVTMSLVLVWEKGGIALLFLVLLLSYITGVVLTIPPPAYHRLSLTFPFIAIVSAIPFSLHFKKYVGSGALGIGLYILFVYAYTNITYFQSTVKKETLIPDAAVITHVNTTYPGRHIHVAAFPGFALERLYPFFQPRTALSIDTQYHATYLDHFDAEEPYLYIITLSPAFKDKFVAIDPEGTYVQFSDQYGLFVNKR